jgi:uncharacterized membrane protein YbhN (UPF0104 family)
VYKKLTLKWLYTNAVKIKNLLNNHKKKINIIILILSIILFYNVFDFEKFKNTINEINYFFLLPALGLSLLIPYLFILRWYYIGSIYQKIKLPQVFKKTLRSILIADIFQNTLIIDFQKMLLLNKLSKKKKLFLLFVEKFFNIKIKIFTILILFNIYTFFYNFYFLKIIILQILIFIFYFFLRYIFIKNKSYFQKKKFLHKKIIKSIIINIIIINNNSKNITIIEILRNFLIILIYYIVLSQIFSFKDILIILILVPVVETLLRFQFLFSLGARELLYLLLATIINVDQNKIIIASSIVSLLMTTSNICNYILVVLLDFFKKNKKIT